MGSMKKLHLFLVVFCVTFIVNNGHECDEGEVKTAYGCAICPAGTFTLGSRCEDCPLGSYSAVGAKECTFCAEGTSTLNVAADDSSLCMEGCVIPAIVGGFAAPPSGTFVPNSSTVVITCYDDGYLPNEHDYYAYSCESIDESVFCSSGGLE